MHYSDLWFIAGSVRKQLTPVCKEIFCNANLGVALRLMRNGSKQRGVAWHEPNCSLYTVYCFGWELFCNLKALSVRRYDQAWLTIASLFVGSLARLLDWPLLQCNLRLPRRFKEVLSKAAQSLSC